MREVVELAAGGHVRMRSEDLFDQRRPRTRHAEQEHGLVPARRIGDERAIENAPDRIDVIGTVIARASETALPLVSRSDCSIQENQRVPPGVWMATSVELR